MPDIPASPFVVLPTDYGRLVSLLGPPPEESATAVEPLVPVEPPLGIVQPVMAALTSAAGEIIAPLEILLVGDSTSRPVGAAVPPAALIQSLRSLAKHWQRTSARPEEDLLRTAFLPPPALGPLFYCRKRHVLFEARSPQTALPLRATPPAEAPPGAAGDAPPHELLVWDGPLPERPPVIYGPRAGVCELGKVRSFEQMIADQGQVVRLAPRLAEQDPQAHRRLLTRHTCCTCPEQHRCYPTEEGQYAFAGDRLVVVHAAETPLMLWPLGLWRLDEAARLLGGQPAAEVLESAQNSHGFEKWRRDQTASLTRGPRLLKESEAGAQVLLEVLRLKLGLIEHVLAQLDDWDQATGRPHLCWNAETVRVGWRAAGQRGAWGWGMYGLLRKVGLQPLFKRGDADAGTPYPPAFAEPSYLPAEVVEAQRNFGGERPAQVFVKEAGKPGDGGRPVRLLLEDIGVPRQLFRPADVVLVRGEGWSGELAPAAEHDPNDGEGLAVHGTARGQIEALRNGETLTSCMCTWYPAFGPAVDLFAIGMLLAETLLCTDERPPHRLRETLATEREALLAALANVPVEQRAAQAAAWVARRSEADTPAAVWSRRNVLYRRAERAAVSLDDFPAALWQAIMLFLWRLVAMTPGFGYCADRAQEGPRLGGALLPLLELRGLIALLDDRLFNRRQVQERLQTEAKQVKK